MNKIKHSIVFQIKTGQKLELLSTETMRLSGSTKKDVCIEKDGEDASNKHFSQLINISPRSLTMLNTTNLESSSIEVWSNDQNSKQLEIEDNYNMKQIIGQIL